MSEPVSTRRHRGGQPGNQNAKNNRGNPRPRPNFGNRGGKGAPKGNKFARKACRRASAILTDDYKNDADACAWIEQHVTQLDSVHLYDERRLDRATRDGHLGLTPERLAELGLERRYGLVLLPADPFEDAIAA